MACLSSRSVNGAALQRTVISSKTPVRPLSSRTHVKTQAILDFLKGPQRAPKVQPKPVRPTVIPEPAYNLQAALIAIAGFEAYQGWYPIAAFTGLLGVFLLYQTTRVQFIFDDEALEVKINKEESDNVVTGTANRWPYSSFTNWEMWWPGFPVLVYFKEDMTKPEGQVHFFPIIFNGKQLFDVMEERCGPRKSQEGKA